jgi:predicted ester cyclase
VRRDGGGGLHRAGGRPIGQSALGKVKGPQHTRDIAQWLLAQFPDLHIKIEAVVAEGDTVACRIDSEGTNLGKHNEMLPPTGKRFSAAQSHWFRVEGNKLVEHWATRDNLMSMIQLGFIQSPDARPS